MRRLRAFALIAALLLAVVCPASAQAVDPQWPDASPPGGGVAIPRLLKEVKPRYTVEAMTAKVQGTVLVECVVEVDGTVRRTRVVRSLDSRFGLDQSALDAVKEWQFEPGTRDGKAVPVLVTVELSFVLRDGPADKAPLTLPEAFGASQQNGMPDDSVWEDVTVRSSLTVELHHPKGWQVQSGMPGVVFMARPANAPLVVYMVTSAASPAEFAEPGTAAELKTAGTMAATAFNRQVEAVGQAKIAGRMWIWFDFGIADAPNDAVAQGLSLGVNRLWIFSAAIEGQVVVVGFTIGHAAGTGQTDREAEAQRAGPTFRRILERLSFTRTQ